MQLGRFLLTKTIWSLGIRVGGVGLGFIAYVLLARAMPMHAYGDFIYCVNLIGLVALIAQAGFQTSILRYAHAYQREPSLLAGFMQISFIVPVLVSVVLAVIGIACSYLNILPEIIDRTLLYTCIGVLFFALTYVAQQTLKAFGRIVASQVYEQIGLPLCLMGVALVYLLTQRGEMLFAVAAWSYNVVFLIIAIITWWQVRRYCYPSQAQPQYRVQHWAAESASLGVVGVVSTFMLRMDVLLVGLYLGSADVAEYGVASRVAALLAFVYAALGNVLTPLISEKLHNNTLEDAMPLVRKLMRLATVLNIAVLAAIIMLRDYILALFGPEYAGAGTVLVILATAQALNLSAGPLGSILSITGHHRLYMIYSCIFAAILAVALFFGITWYGTLGAACSVAVVNLSMHAALMVLVARKTGIRTL